jgi:hypothetical protein
MPTGTKKPKNFKETSFATNPTWDAFREHQASAETSLIHAYLILLQFADIAFLTN